MSSNTVIKNIIDDNEYRVSIAHVDKRASVPNPLGLPGLPNFDFNDIILEAAIFPQKKFYKPQFLIALNDGYSQKMTEEAFTKFVHEIIANERIEDSMDGQLSLYKKYGFYATEHDMWQLLFLSKLRIVFIYKDPNRE